MEMWKDIPTYEGIYQVSDLGNVKSLRYGKERLLKQSIQPRGYCIVDLSGKSYRVHTLVMWAFKNILPTGTTADYVIDHIDNNPSNNCLSNLQLLSHRDNITKGKLPSGARLDKRTGRWLAKIKINKKVKYLGSFGTKEEAENRYKQELLTLTPSGVNLSKQTKN